MAQLSRLVPAFISALGFQSICAAIFVPREEEKYFDLAGALGFLTTTAVSLYYPVLKTKILHDYHTPLPPLSSFAPRQLLLCTALGTWSVRLGVFLFSRALLAGGDSRFDKVKHDRSKFTIFWMVQAAWVFLVGLPVYMVCCSSPKLEFINLSSEMANTLPSTLHPPLGPRDYVAFCLFMGFFLFEVVADTQKSIWRRAKDNKEHDEKFITRGLWSISRHPNYVGEVGIWATIWALSTGTIRSAYFPRYVPLLTLVSPLTTYLLVRYVSGVPVLEKLGDEKYGDDPEWKKYTSNVPVFWPVGSHK